MEEAGEGAPFGERKAPALGEEHQVAVPAFSPSPFPAATPVAAPAKKDGDTGSGSGKSSGGKEAASALTWRPDLYPYQAPAQTQTSAPAGGSDVALVDALRAAAAAQMQPGLIVHFLKKVRRRPAWTPVVNHFQAHQPPPAASLPPSSRCRSCPAWMPPLMRVQAH